MGYEDMTDAQILEKLLNADEAPIPQRTVFIKRLGIPVVLQGISEKQLAALRNKYTYTIRGKRGGPDTKEFDSENFALALIAACAAKPNFKDEALLNKYKASGPEEVLKNIFLPGELDQLSNIVYELCGFDEGVEEIEEIKN
ncbi:phage tail assembly chaperone [Mahella australiensis]|uniref:XkdN-like protein n=1 Tax=Mahella australiensis (strain DSM 15567 / CIP 107919 / 50-1 BON) TaxID=697281 RepID=F3ZZW8_MAHA5|nr:XkdN-like protein [Mahella australiensis]AEE95786.1 XkdN-like protein [Mahella australiensis 50-1 BON]